MRLHLLSDLHFEFGSIEIPDTDADVVVLAGDISVGPRGYDWIKQRFRSKPVVYAMGNHEFYRHNLPRLTQLLQREAEGSNIHVLENRTVELSGFSILGCTLWTDFAVRGHQQRDMINAETRINDYRIIRFGAGDSVLQAKDTVGIHRESVSWLKSELPRHDPERTIVVTHHAPSPRSEAPGYANGMLSASFVSDLDSIIERSGIPLWIHGHTHHCVDYQLGKTRILSNQRGYPNETNASFDPALVIEI